MIYAIVMAGGRGTRLKVNVEKPLFKLHGKPLIKYVLDNISSSKLVEDVVIAVSPHTQETIKYLKSLNTATFSPTAKIPGRRLKKPLYACVFWLAVLIT